MDGDRSAILIEKPNVKSTRGRGDALTIMTGPTSASCGCDRSPRRAPSALKRRRRDRSGSAAGRSSLQPSPSSSFSSSSRGGFRSGTGGMGFTSKLFAATVLLLGGAVVCANGRVPDGLLFANEIGGATPAVTPPRSGENANLSRKRFVTTYENAEDSAQAAGEQRPGGGGERVHPIKRIYRDNAHIRRRMEDLENSLPYFQTGMRGDPNHIVKYRNHPFDVMRRAREREQEEEMRKIERVKGGDGGKDAANELEDDERSLQEDEGGAAGANGDDGSELDDDPFRPIRIHFDTSALDSELTDSNGDQIEFVKSIILPRMADYWTSALSVVPVEGNLLVSTAELQGRLYCGDTEFSKVPSSHISTGVPETDLVLYVSGAPSARFCGPSTLAVAVACNFDQFDRPTAGAINFCLDQIDLDEEGGASESVTDDNVDVAVHEAAHVLGMSSNSYRFFWDPNTGLVRTARPFAARSVICVDGVERSLVLPDDNTMKFFIATNGQRYASIVTPRVATVARNQFDCQELNGAQLENQPTGENSCTGDHWDERMYYPEALSGVISPTTNVLSPLTLALLEDSGWYRANYTKAHVSPWGHGVGCDFVSSPCLVGKTSNRDGTLPSYAKGYFCNKASSRGCSPHHTHKMACTVIDYSLRGDYLPDIQFQYFQNSAIGGPREADYCPVYGSVYSGLKPADLDCRIEGNEDTIEFIYSEVYGDDSMCFETTSGEGRCYKAKCIYEDFNLQLQVDGRWYTCKEDFEQIEVSTLSGAFGTTVTCPRLSSVCPDMFCPVNCAGRGKCVFDYSSNRTAAPRPRCECFDKTDTSAGCSDTFVLDGKYLRDGTSLTDTLKTNFFEPLIAVFVDHPDTWTTASWAWAAALFVVFLLMILCICSSFWPEKEKKRRRPPPRGKRRNNRYAV